MSQPNINVEELKNAIKFLAQCKENTTKAQYEILLEYLNKAFPPQPKEEWRPDIQDTYWYISTGGNLEGACWTGTMGDKNRLDFRNCFKTREAAEAHLSKYKEWLKGLQD